MLTDASTDASTDTSQLDCIVSCHVERESVMHQYTYEKVAKEQQSLPETDKHEPATIPAEEQSKHFTVPPNIWGTSIDHQAATLHRATNGNITRAGHALQQLQRTYGNQHVQRLVNQTRTIQPKLMLGDVDTPHEQEAHQIAQELLHKGETTQTPTPVQQAETPVPPPVENAIQAAKGHGQPLASEVQTAMGPALGINLNQVRVHTDGRADTLNQSLQSHAFTTGQDIFFRRGTYDPSSQHGQALLAHELTHVAQQQGNSHAPPIQRLVIRIRLLEEMINPKNTTIKESSQTMTEYSKFKGHDKWSEDIGYKKGLKDTTSDEFRMLERNEPLVIVSHGTEPNRLRSSKFGRLGARELAGMVKNLIPSNHGGEIFLNGCFTGMRHNYTKEGTSFIERFGAALLTHKSDYTGTIKGNIGPAATATAEVEKIETTKEMAMKHLQVIGRNSAYPQYNYRSKKWEYYLINGSGQAFYTPATTKYDDRGFTEVLKYTFKKDMSESDFWELAISNQYESTGIHPGMPPKEVEAIVQQKLKEKQKKEKQEKSKPQSSTTTMTEMTDFSIVPQQQSLLSSSTHSTSDKEKKKEKMKPMQSQSTGLLEYEDPMMIPLQSISSTISSDKQGSPHKEKTKSPKPTQEKQMPFYYNNNVLMSRGAWEQIRDAWHGNPKFNDFMELSRGSIFIEFDTYFESIQDKDDTMFLAIDKIIEADKVRKDAPLYTG